MQTYGMIANAKIKKELEIVEARAGKSSMYYLIPKKEVTEANECIPYVAKAPKIVPKKRGSSVPTKRYTHGTPTDHIGKRIGIRERLHKEF